MTAEFSIAGVFVSGALLTASIACVAFLLLRPILRFVGFYRLVWHRSLFDIALFVILWSLSAMVLPLLVESVTCKC
ncbi:MAG TPA: DUF1656 domain-containing protein [Aliidongia sp.]|nr:DUF1656 domain-containing protein [Aliidongia sp.]